MHRLIRNLLLLITALSIAVPIAAQIKVINPFGHPQGAVQQLTTVALVGDYQSPPLQANGLAVKYFPWCGHQWANDSGQAFNTQVPYAIGLNSAVCKVRFELHDTIYDRGQSDPSTKRRAELSSVKDKFVNGVDYWMAFSFKVHWDCPACQKRVNAGGEIMQVHWPSGASPPLAFRVVPCSAALACFRITTRGVGQGNINRYTGALALDLAHDAVFHFRLGAIGYEETWLDGKQVSNLHGIPVGTDQENGYSMRLGPYYGEGMAGNVAVQEYGNIAAFPSTVDMTARIFTPPAL